MHSRAPIRFAGRHGQQPSQAAVNIAFFLNLLLPFVFRRVACANQHQNTHSELADFEATALVSNIRCPHVQSTLSSSVQWSGIPWHSCWVEYHCSSSLWPICNRWAGVMGVRAGVRVGGWVGGGHHGCHGSAIVICHCEPRVHDHLGTDMHMHTGMSMWAVLSSHAMHQCMMYAVVT